MPLQFSTYAHIFSICAWSAYWYMWFMQMSFPKPHWVSSKPVHIWLRYGTPGGIFSQADFNEIRCQSLFALNTLKFWVSSKMVHIWPRYGTPGGEHKSKQIYLESILIQKCYLYKLWFACWGGRFIFSCPGRLNKWHCLSFGQSVGVD